MDYEKLIALEEYAAYGFYEALDKPYPFAYAHGMRRLYEMQETRLLDDYILVPSEPSYMAVTSYGDVMHGGKSSHLRGLERDDSKFTHANGRRIFYPDISYGLSISRPTVEMKKAQFPEHAEFIDELVQDLEKYCLRRSGWIHSNPDTLTVVQKGFLFMVKEIEEEIEKAKIEQDQDGLDYLYAMLDYAEGVIAYYQRHLKALEKAVSEAEGERKRKLAVILEGYRNCFLKPSDNFVSGLLAVNLCWMLDGCDSIGRLDYVLGDLLEKDLAEDRIELPFVRELLDDLWRLFDRYSGWNMQLGGMTPEGTECYNTLTRECLLCNIRHNKRRPNLSLRITKNMPTDIWNLALTSLAGGNGTPALYHEELYLESMRRYLPEIEEKDLTMYGLGGCSETMITGMSCVDSIGEWLNLGYCLMSVLFNGKHLISGREWGLKTGDFVDFETFEDFYAALKKQIAFGTEAMAAALNEYQPCSETFRVRSLDEEINNFGFADGAEHVLCKTHKVGDPRIVRSMFTRGCTAKRKPFDMGGAKYNWCEVTYQGSTVLIDSVAAVKQCVFDEKTISKETLIEALKNDFKGYEDVQQLLKKADKFGNGIEWVDEIAHDLMDFIWEQTLQYNMSRGGRMVPCLIVFNTYANTGREICATPNGRNAGTPLNDSVGAFEGADVNGPTALIHSVTNLPLTKAFGTPIFNLRFNKQLFMDEKSREKVMYLLKGYFEKGGLQAQVSVLSAKEMREAQKEPEKYKDLIVRIGGYSEYFVYLSPELQETVIKRTDYII